MEQKTFIPGPKKVSTCSTSRCSHTFGHVEYIYIPDSDIACSNISKFLNSILFLFWICVYCFLLLGITALLKLGT